jgi:hypothetical protein
MHDARTHSLTMDYREVIDIAIMPTTPPIMSADPEHRIPRRNLSITRLHPVPLSPTHPSPPFATLPPVPTPPQFRVQQPTPPPASQASPRHARHPIAQLMRVPRYQMGRDRFPPPERRFHPRGIELLIHNEHLAGTFDEECFRTQWASIGWRIDNRVINQVKPETQYHGPQFRVTTTPAAWPTPVRRGDVITFRTFTAPDVKYFVAWTINGDHDNDHAYIQVNALNRDQQCVHSNDIDWPTLGFLIPKDKCHVRDAPEHPIPPIQASSNTDFSPSSPSLSDSSTPLKKRPRLGWKKSMPTTLKRMASLDILKTCKKANAADDMELATVG